MLLPSRSEQITIRRILKVNHAGETGAIRIYSAQIAMARRRFPDMVAALETMKRDEVEHEALFRRAMPARGARPCRVMSLWKHGGWVLGAVTALVGRQAIWICTEAVEHTVHRHLDHQLAFLEHRDPALHKLILSIRDEELAHLREARSHQVTGWHRRIGIPLISAVTEMLIGLSTWGDSVWMAREMDAQRARSTRV